MIHQFRILVADRNRHVREFLSRELAKDSFFVLETAADGLELLTRLQRSPLPDLLVLDLELPLLQVCEMAEKLREMGVEIPIVLHSFPPEVLIPCKLEEIGPFVEKSENIQGLKETIWESLKKAYPARFQTSQRRGEAPGVC